MKHLALTLAALSAATSLAACSKKEAVTTEAAAPASDLAATPMAAEAKTAKGTGTVTAVGEDSVTVDHAAIPEANWPAMTMAFKATPEIAKSVKAGDKVTFDLKLEDGGGEIIAITER